MADPESDEVYSKIKLVPVRNSEPDYDDDGVGNNGNGNGSEVRGTPRRHLLTTGCTFVNHKKLIAGDSIVLHRISKLVVCQVESRVVMDGRVCFHRQVMSGRFG